MHAEKEISGGHGIQPMTSIDLAEVMAIECSSFPNPWSRPQFESELKNPISFAYTVKTPSVRGPVLAAYVVFWVVHGEAHILNLAVKKDLRRTGIASRLMEYVLEMMRSNMVFEAFLEVRASNKAARNLYRKLGFKEAYERKNYYGDEDAVVMTRGF
ncbi:MAG: ribosomal protein S18-alanine N-acetyltransferase [Deltaproteobacteria bacterium]|nr:ribosomal protein S18-alanine N-acetyltransferase [Deltaproteobacteria bacterium]